jgi:hypothetical protein
MPEHYIIHRFDHEGDGSTDLWWSQVCSLSDWEREIFENIVCNQLFRTVNHAELPSAVRKVLCHYMGNVDQVVNSVDGDSTQVVKKRNWCNAESEKSGDNHCYPVTI